ncbi:MAG: hypothetical protein QXR53_00555 [Candidatus Norongarragalinales archaeon]
MSFSWDFAAATAIVLILAWAFVSAFYISSNSLASGLAFAEKQRAALFKADFLLKNCFPVGIAHCEGGFAHSHEASASANLTFGGGSFCVKRLVLQGNAARVVVVCV